MTGAHPALEQFLRSIPLFRLVDAPHMPELLRLVRPVMLDAGQELFREGEPGDALWVLGEGVEVSLAARVDGAEAPVALATAVTGETLGEMALVDDGVRSATAVVTRPGPAHQISAMDFHVLRDAWHPVAFQVLRQVCLELCRRLRATEERVAPGGERPDEVDLPAGARVRPEQVSAFAPFAALPQVVKLALAQKLRAVEVPDGLRLFAEGQRPDGAFFLVEGGVELARGGRTIGRVAPGSMFGLVSVLDGGPRSATAHARGPTRLFRLADADFDHLFATGNRYAYRLVDLASRQLVARLRQLNRMVPPGGAAVVAGAGAEVLPIDFELAVPDAVDEALGALSFT